MISPANKRILCLIGLQGQISCTDLHTLIGTTNDNVKKKLGYFKLCEYIVALPKERGKLVHYELSAKGRKAAEPDDDRPPLPVVPSRTWQPQSIMTAAECPRMQSNREGADRAAAIKSLGAF